MAPVDNLGYWGKPTSTIDWCENNYVESFYIAEMYNTLSNLMIIVPPIWGMFEVGKQNFDRKFLFCHLLVLIVGLGSWAFHMTLRYEMQLFDELPMVWGTSVLVYCLSEVRSATNDRAYLTNIPLFCLLLSFASLFTAIYLLYPLPVLQHSSYGILVISSFVLELRILHLHPCNVCRHLFLVSTSTYLFGFFLWNIDNLFCSKLRALRAFLPAVISPLTQLHSWWHCLAGYGSYLHVLFCIHASYDFQSEKKPSRRVELGISMLGFRLGWENAKRKWTK